MQKGKIYISNKKSKKELEVLKRGKRIVIKRKRKRKKTYIGNHGFGANAIYSQFLYF